MAKKDVRRDPIETEEIEPVRRPSGDVVPPSGPAPPRAPQPASAPEPEAPSDLPGALALVEQEDTSVVETQIDPGADNRPGNRTVMIRGIRHEHIREAADGRWIYRKG